MKNTLTEAELKKAFRFLYVMAAAIATRLPTGRIATADSSRLILRKPKAFNSHSMRQKKRWHKFLCMSFTTTDGQVCFAFILIIQK